MACLLNETDEYISTRAAFGVEAQIVWTRGQNRNYSICAVRTQEMQQRVPLPPPMKFVFAHFWYCYKCSRERRFRQEFAKGCKHEIRNWADFRHGEYRTTIDGRPYMKLESSTHDWPALFDCHALLSFERSLHYQSYAADPIEGDIDHAGRHIEVEIRRYLAASHDISPSNVCFFPDKNGCIYRFALVLTNLDLFVHRYKSCTVYDEMEHSPDKHYVFGIGGDSEFMHSEQNQYRREHQFYVVKVDRSGPPFYSLRHQEVKHPAIVPKEFMAKITALYVRLKTAVRAAFATLFFDHVNATLQKSLAKIVVDYCIGL